MLCRFKCGPQRACPSGQFPASGLFLALSVTPIARPQYPLVTTSLDFRTSEEIMPVRQSVLLLGMEGVHNKHKEWKES